MEVKVWQEKVSIPTYGLGDAEKNPIFLEKRVYQGSSGVVYPNPVIEKICDEKEDKEWIGLFLENKYLKIMILPELGGRVQMAYDKIKQRHFVYYNQVIKPALVGLTGPWISGGIEFNWPQHHRPSTFEPIDFDIEENEDESKTVWVSELERMSRTKGMTGFTIHPDKSYLEIKVKLYNRTCHPQTFLWWANPAVKVNDDYQSVFPPDVHAVFDHGKRDVSSFPIATGTYYKVDYSAGVDISKYKNIPVPTSYMAINSEFDFVGGYENDTEAGLLHVADHNVSPGKKQWTWGNGDFGKEWDKNLTDEDGPYIELMCGVYTDNQPDFTWLHPYEEKPFKQYFMPFRDLGGVKNASKEAMLNIEFSDNKAVLKIYATSNYPQSTISLYSHGKLISCDEFDLSPEAVFNKELKLPVDFDKENYYIGVKKGDGIVLIDYTFNTQESKPLPEAAKVAKLPKDIDTTEQLFFRGQHLEQYRHATYNPADYYLEALERDPSDHRCNNAMGLLLLRKAKFAEAEKYFKKAIVRLTEINPNPYDGEALFNLGLALKMQAKYEEAYSAFYKSAWNAAWQDAAYFNLAQLACLKNDIPKALEFASWSLERNWNNHKARHLKIALQRLSGNTDVALELVEDSLGLDKFNFGVLYEKYLISNDEDVLQQLKKQLRDHVHSYIEYAIDYISAGLYVDAIKLLRIYIDGKDAFYPMAGYFIGYCYRKIGETSSAKKHYNQASLTAPDYCFPNRIEEVIVLEDAVQFDSNDAKAYYYLGNFWYHNRLHEEATSTWEKSAAIDSKFPTVIRNLSLAYYNKQNNPVKARTFLEKAFELNTSDTRILMELDQLYKKVNIAPAKRLEFLEKYPENVLFRDDLILERITLLNILDQEDKALQAITNHKFHPWEGGEGKVIGQYQYSHIEIAKKAILSGNNNTAIEHLNASLELPENLGEGNLHGIQENDLNFWMGCAYEAKGEIQEAENFWKKAVKGLSEPIDAMYYNDQQPDTILYQGLALLKLGEENEAKSRFNRLIDYGNEHLSDDVIMDYFAISLPDLTPNHSVYDTTHSRVVS